MCLHGLVLTISLKRGTGGPAHTLYTYAYAIVVLLVLFALLLGLSVMLERNRQANLLTTSMSRLGTAVPAIIGGVMLVVSFCECARLSKDFRGLVRQARMVRVTDEEGTEVLSPVGRDSTADEDENAMERAVAESPEERILADLSGSDPDTPPR